MLARFGQADSGAGGQTTHEDQVRAAFNSPFRPFVLAYERLRTTLAAYRMVFGQARQEDILAYLYQHLETSELVGLAQQLRIDLTPAPFD